MCIPAEPASLDDDMVYFDSVESACFDSDDSNIDGFYECASSLSPRFIDYLKSYIAYPLLGFPVMLAHGFHQLRFFYLNCFNNMS